MPNFGPHPNQFSQYDAADGDVIKATGGDSPIYAADTSGGLVTSWTTWSPTGTWLLNTNYTGRYRRINDTIHATVHIGLTGAPTSAQLAIDLPSGLTCDETKLPFTLNTVGHGINRDGSGIYSSIITLYDTAIDNQIQIYVGQNTSNLLSPVNATNPHAWANNHYLQFTFWVPITEWA